MVTGFTRIVAALALLCWPALAADNPYLPARDPAPILAAIEKEAPDFAPPAGVTGISVPHHLLAADLIARGFWAASAGRYSRIIVISPDHFHKVTKPFGTTRETLETVFGPMAPDLAAIDALAADERVELLDTIETEHGVMAVMPFVRRFFPAAEVVPLLASVNAKPEDWRTMAAALLPLVTPDTLVVQSTDYSHYRTYAEAIARDQETLAVVATGDPEGVVPLLQPAHMDSKAAQYIQMALQGAAGAHPVVLANANSVDYGSSIGSTTSYIVTAWLRDTNDGAGLAYADQSRVMFGGDVLLGRYFLPALRDPSSWGRLRDTVLAATQGTSLIVNLEGVLLDGPVTGVDFNTHVMVTADAAPIIAALNIGAASLANNHANDLGPEGRAETRRLLDALDVAAMEHGALTDLGAFRLLPLNFVGGKFIGEAIADPEALDWVCDLDAAPPLVAFLHWGKEYVGASDKERRIAETLARCGVSLIVGAHSHQASERIEVLRGGAAQLAYSLGNFIFDQSAPRGSGTLLELRVFRQGTIAVRLVPIPNLFDLTKP
ncbi:MAG: AmmeMemoRadiSam system protein B [Hyphomicrobiales bacterium]|nr:MAG: AmmeMemoRadiSam system protein B [Hyphomicrobiales bacterium]